MSWPPTSTQLRGDLRRTTAQASDAELLEFIEAAVELLEIGDREHGAIGPHQGQSLTAVRYFSRAGDLVLPWRAASVEAVTADGVDSGFTFDPDESPRIVRGPFGPYRPSLYSFILRQPKVRVVAQYTAPVSVPANVERACVVLAAHLWQQAHPGAQGSDGAASPMGYAIPNRVWQMVAGYAVSNDEVA